MPKKQRLVFRSRRTPQDSHSYSTETLANIDYANLEETKPELSITAEHVSQWWHDLEHELCNYLCDHAYQSLLEHINPDEQDLLRAAAIGYTHRHYALQPDNNSAYLNAFIFLMDLNALSDGAHLIEQHAHRFINYYAYGENSLQDAAKRLAPHYPLAATLLYRSMIETMLKRSPYEFYGSVWIRHKVCKTYFLRNKPDDELRMCKQLAHEIASWNGHLSHEEYLAYLKTTYAWRRAFWKRNKQI